MMTLDVHSCHPPAAPAGKNSVANSQSAISEPLAQFAPHLVHSPLLAADIDTVIDILSDLYDKWSIKEYSNQARETYHCRFSPFGGTVRPLEIYRFAVGHPIEWSRCSRGSAGRRTASGMSI